MSLGCLISPWRGAYFCWQSEANYERRRAMKILLNWFTYGMVEDACALSLISEIQYAMAHNQQIMLSPVGGDALISRSRSVMMSKFLDTPGDVLFFLDHDIAFAPGAIVETCRQALNRDAIVSGMYSVRGLGQGFAGRPLLKRADESFDVRLGTDQFIEAEWVSGGFVAFPKSVVVETLKAGKDAAESLVTGRGLANWQEQKPWNLALTESTYTDGKTKYHDFFRPMVVPERLIPGTASYLSEDYAFSWRAREANPKRKQYFWAMPTLIHYGKYGYVMAEAAQKAVVEKPLLIRP